MQQLLQSEVPVFLILAAQGYGNSFQGAQNNSHNFSSLKGSLRPKRDGSADNLDASQHKVLTNNREKYWEIR